jgi:hypothetical protein
MYKLFKDEITNTIACVQLEKDGYLISIPLDPANTDYQQYLKWVEEGNSPLPADEGAA